MMDRAELPVQTNKTFLMVSLLVTSAVRGWVGQGRRLLRVGRGVGAGQVRGRCEAGAR